MQRNIVPQNGASSMMRMFESSDDLLGEIQAALAALADLDCRFEIDREQLQLGLQSASAKERLCAERESRRRREREPYVHRLSELEERMGARLSCR